MTTVGKISRMNHHVSSVTIFSIESVITFIAGKFLFSILVMNLHMFPKLKQLMNFYKKEIVDRFILSQGCKI